MKTRFAAAIAGRWQTEQARTSCRDAERAVQRLYSRRAAGRWRAHCNNDSVPYRSEVCRQVHIMVEIRGRPGVTIVGLGMLSELGGAVHGSMQIPEPSWS